MGALGVYVTARLVTRFATPRPWPPPRGARLAALRSALESALVMVRYLSVSVRCCPARSAAAAADVAAQPACVAPLALALWVSASRIHDYAHSAGDVVGGLALGAGFGAVLLLRTAALDRTLRQEAPPLLT